MSHPIVLIHGAWHGAWAFDKVTEPLQSQGLEVEAIDLPLNGVVGDIEAARACIARHPGAVVLGHSYGGIVITHAAAGLDVSHLVYLAAAIPDRDEDIAALMAEFRSPSLQQAMDAPNNGQIILDAELAIEAFYHDCDPREAKAAAARLRPHSRIGLPTLDSDPVWRSVASTYVVCAADKALHPELQRQLSARTTNAVEWECAHSPFLACPALVVDLLSDLARR